MRDQKINGFEKYEVRDAADTLIRAEAIKNDKRKGFYETVKRELVRKTQDAEQAVVNAKSAAGLTERAKMRRQKRG